MTTTRRKTRSKPTRSTKEKPAQHNGAQPVMALARQVRSWAGTALGLAGSAADMSLALAKSSVSPRRRGAIEKAGVLLKQMRETAGLTAQELGHAIDLRDASMLEQAESGRVVLPFEIILRLAAVLGRRDPVAFVMNLTRSYYPELWKALEDLGVGRLVAHAGREREFVNIYRASDEARRLNDEQFARVLAFVGAAFELALSLVRAERARKPVVRSAAD
ncbi:MAG TPA: helix-turn-helix transcriptional regulator [Burkholderiaceae bacterium]|nr:helix-turn-helix transcriptional regulator [Burkholderiaceae bacterium]